MTDATPAQPPSRLARKDVGDAIGFSSFAVLLYYAIANASAITLDEVQRRRSLAWPVAGLFGCVLLASSLPLASVAAGAALIVAVGVVHQISSRRRASTTDSTTDTPRTDRNNGSGSS